MDGLRERVAKMIQSHPRWDGEQDNADGLADDILRLLPGDEGLRGGAIRLRNCLRNLTDGTGDGDAELIEEGRRAVIETGYLDAPRQEEGEKG